MRNKLPELCCSVLPSTGELIIIKSGERGYYQSEWNTDSREENQKIADFTNSRLGITPAELEAMICGSMSGWDAPGAQPQFYLDLASREKSTEITGHLMHPCLSSCYPIKGYLHTYRIMGKAVYYIDFISMPKSLMEERFGYIYSPDLVNGKPMMPVTYHQSQNGTYTLRLVDGSFHQSEMEHAGYAINLGPGVPLDDLRKKHGIDHRPRSISLRAICDSDILLVQKNGKQIAYYVETEQFQELPSSFSSKLTQQNETGKVKRKHEPER